MEPIVRHKVPTVETYLSLRKAGGMGSYSEESAAAGLPHSLFSVVVEIDGKTVGMGRLVGDGGLFVQVTDIVVLPEHQGKGLAKRIMSELMNWITENLPTGAYVNLLADVPANKLYEKYGFKETAPKTIGMAKRSEASNR